LCTAGTAKAEGQRGSAITILKAGATGSLISTEMIGDIPDEVCSALLRNHTLQQICRFSVHLERKGQFKVSCLQVLPGPAGAGSRERMGIEEIDSKNFMRSNCLTNIQTIGCERYRNKNYKNVRCTIKDVRQC
jgi:hypothetical protein